MKAIKYFNVIVENKIKKSELEDLINILIEDENYEYANMVKELIEINHYDDNTTIDIKKEEKLRLELIESLSGIGHGIDKKLEDFKEDDVTDSEMDNAKNLLSDLEDIEKLIMKKTEEKIKKGYNIIYPMFKTQTSKDLFQKLADDFIIKFVKKANLL